MLRAMDSAVAGLRAHQNKLDVIGHNIANVNTYGYKSQNYTFQEAMYQTSSASTGGTDQAGGTNAAQYGYGSLMGSITTDMTASTPTYLGGFNASIEGQGFFVTMAVKDKTLTKTGLKGQEVDYTRVGMFSIDSQGYMVDSNGNFVYGFQANNAVDAKEGYKDTMSALRAPSDTGEDFVVFYDANGTKYTSSMETMTAGTYSLPADDGTATLNVTVTGNATSGFSFIATTTPTGGAEATTSVTTEMESVYNFTGQAALLSNVSINSLGEVTATVQATGETITFGKVAIATFQNPEGLTKAGSIYYNASETDNAGICTAEVPGGTVSGLMTGYVEASNVDLAREFSDMITTQRGFQANSRIITVSDQILEELVNLKR